MDNQSKIYKAVNLLLYLKDLHCFADNYARVLKSQCNHSNTPQSTEYALGWTIRQMPRHHLYKHLNAFNNDNYMDWLHFSSLAYKLRRGYQAYKVHKYVIYSASDLTNHYPLPLVNAYWNAVLANINNVYADIFIDKRIFLYTREFDEIFKYIQNYKFSYTELCSLFGLTDGSNIPMGTWCKNKHLIKVLKDKKHYQTKKSDNMQSNKNKPVNHQTMIKSENKKNIDNINNHTTFKKDNAGGIDVINRIYKLYIFISKADLRHLDIEVRKINKSGFFNDYQHVVHFEAMLHNRQPHFYNININYNGNHGIALSRINNYLATLHHAFTMLKTYFNSHEFKQEFLNNRKNNTLKHRKYLQKLLNQNNKNLKHIDNSIEALKRK